MADNMKAAILALTGWTLCALLALPLPAQDRPIPDTSGLHQDSLTRLFKGNYTPPPVHTLQLRGENLLMDMIKDGRIELTEEDAVRLALAGNVDINVLRYNPYHSLWGVEGSRSVLNPTIQFSSNMNRLVTPSTSALQGGTTLLSLSNLYSVDIHKPFAPGLDFDFNFNTTRARTNSIFSSLNPSITSTWSIGITQHLLKDFGNISRTRFLTIARNNYDVTLEGFISGATEIITRVLNAYWELVFNDEDIKVKEASLNLARTVLDQTRIQAEVGTMSSLDVLQAEAEVAGRNQQVIVSRNSRRITEDQLKKLISSQLDPGRIVATIVPASRPEEPEAPPRSATEAIERALEVRPEVKQLLINQETNKLQVEYARNQLRPTLDFVAGYSQNGLGGDTIIRDYSGGLFGAPIIGFVPGGFGDSLNSLFSGRNLGYTFGLTFRVPIGNDQARASSAQAQIAYKQGEENLRSLRQQIALEVRQAFDAMELNRSSVEAADVTVRYQQQRLQGEQDKYMLGASTTRFILEAQRDLQNAQSILLQAKIDWIKSRIAFDKAMGNTFDAHNIILAEALNLPGK